MKTKSIALLLGLLGSLTSAFASYHFTNSSSTHSYRVTISDFYAGGYWGANGQESSHFENLQTYNETVGPGDSINFEDYVDDQRDSDGVGWYYMSTYSGGDETEL